MPPIYPLPDVVPGDPNHSSGLAAASHHTIIHRKLNTYVDAVSDFDADPTGTADSSPMIQAALDYLKSLGGGVLVIPAGIYKLLTALYYSTTGTGLHGGVIIEGAGWNRTILDYQGAAAAAIVLGSATSLGFQLQTQVRNLQIMSTAGSGVRHGIYAKALWQGVFSNVYVSGMTGSGFFVDSPLGDPDGSVALRFAECWSWTNNRYGFEFKCGAGTANISYARLEQCNAQQNGLGGCYWTGAQIAIRGGGFATNEGPGLLVDYVNATNFNLDVQDTSFENNKTAHVVLKSLSGGTFKNVDFRNTVAAYAATRGIHVVPPAGAFVGRVRVEVPDVQVLPAFSPYTMFDLDGTNAEIRSIYVVTPAWRTFDAAGQTRFAITNTSNVHDIVRGDDFMENVAGITLSAGDNNDFGIGLDAGVFYIDGNAAACAITGFANGYHHRRIRLIIASNPAGITFKSDNAGSAVGNRLFLTAGTDRVLANTRVEVEFMYSTRMAGTGGWVLTSATPFGLT